jgi:hypothetical protein
MSTTSNSNAEQWLARTEMRKLRVDRVVRELERAQKVMIESERQRRDGTHGEGKVT